ncbi:hypothetical protein SAMN05444487_11121 [Marininema mesophilum]|uniref:TIGR00282 family metallophosphoesterase n=1 Tax=Marininema mesophilum TaxID=1048340 RepID=A0A1H2ZDI4_9BACL|nr:TIGR00282 family metallophosphoesterase [Marininema mesophilum]SDX15451.1 hypothetical protein SAMN05444487_11121 [Marininema mesophilum]
MRVLMIGDIMGEVGRSALSTYLPRLKRTHQPDAIIVNGENAADDGRGITRGIAREFFGAGIDGITLGNHTWDKREIFDFIDDEPRMIRPANYPEGAPGASVAKLSLSRGELTVISLMGRTFLANLDCPFRKADEILKSLGKTGPILVDFHAETTSEKQALSWYLDGRVSAVIGTHTHVQTADERILPGGTAFLSDVGMTGPYDSVLGMEREIVIKRFLTQLPVRFEVAEGRVQLNGVLLDFDSSGKARGIKRIRIDDDQPWFE